jgi:hypothetical protein
MILVSNHTFSETGNQLRALLMSLTYLVTSAILKFKMAANEIVFAHISVCKAHIDLIWCQS